ncbi:MAG TPA: hypothetical protein VF773_12130 [Verrucomicrobiae bacterium]
MKQKNHLPKLTDNVTSFSALTPSLPLPQGRPLAMPTLPVAISSSQPTSIQPHAPAQVPSTLPAFAPAASAPDLYLQIKVDSLKEKQRANSFFNSLDSDQCSKLINWFSELENNPTEIWRRVQAPPPEGLGLKVSHMTIRRLRDAWRAEDLVTSTRSCLDVIIDLEEQTGLNQAARIQTAMNQMLSETAFEMMRTQPASPLLPELLSNIQKLTDLDLKRQKLQLEREKLLAAHTQRYTSAQNGPPSPSIQHHRVDLNIVPPNTSAPRESVVIQSEPEPQLNAPAL